MFFKRIRTERKKRRILRYVRGLARKTTILVEDETDLLLFPPLRAGWAPRGESVRVWLTGFNARRVIFGAMDLRTGRRLFQVREHQRSADFQVLLHAISQQYGKRTVVMLLDEDTSHTAKASEALAKALGIRFLWLPKRSPELNPMDTLWGHAKNLICANRQYATIDEQASHFVEYLNSLSDEAALSMAGTLSEHFWLRSALSN